MIDPRSGEAVQGRMVSSQGRITSKNGRKSRGYRRINGSDAYYRTKICLASKWYHVLVHELVAYAFLGPPSLRNSEVRHKDLDKANNAVENLEYSSSLVENNSHGMVKGCHPPLVRIHSRLYGSCDEWRPHPSIKCAALDLGLDPTAIGKCTRGLRRQTGGYEFRPSAVATRAGPAGPAVQQLLEEWRVVDAAAFSREDEDD